MPTVSSSYITLLGLAAAMILLFVLSNKLALYIQRLFIVLTRSPDIAMLGLFFTLFPGIYIHEGAHWIMARALGLRASRFRVWPKRQGRSIGMGSVSVQQADPIRDSLVGLAPLIAGSILITVISHTQFDAYALTTALIALDLKGAWQIFWSELRGSDGAVWAYLLFVIANAMMPSSSDREPLKPVLLYLAAATVLYLFLGLPLELVTSGLNGITPILRDLTSALALTILLDLAVLVVLVFFVSLFENQG